MLQKFQTPTSDWEEGVFDQHLRSFKMLRLLT